MTKITSCSSVYVIQLLLLQPVVSVTDVGRMTKECVIKWYTYSELGQEAGRKQGRVNSTTVDPERQ